MDASHVLVAFDSSKRSRAALAEGAAAARRSGGRLTVLTLVAVEKPARCCNMQTTFWNQEMRRLAEESIARARALVGDDIDARFVIREGSGQRAVVAAASELGCDAIVKPTRRGRSSGWLTSL